jgi:molybdopterin/thiamine biosynthesis adenylyltransferase
MDRQLRGADLRITGAHWSELTDHLLGDGHEQSALLICGIRAAADEVSYLVQDVVLLGDDDYVDRGALHLCVAPITLARYTKRARLRGAAVVLVHSHPFSGRVAASPIDLATEGDLCRRVLPARTGSPSAALVIGPNGVDARAWTERGAAPLHTIHVLGDHISRLIATSFGLPQGKRAARLSFSASPDADPDDSPEPGGGATARQELLWGAAGQRILSDSRVIVVGCGGTGSHVINQLAHLRVGHLTLIDDDVVETSNLSRLIGAAPGDVGRHKVDVLADHVRAVNPRAHVVPVEASVLDAQPALYTGADVIVCTTDGHGSRSLLTDASAQYLVPVVDLGVEVVPDVDAFRAGGGVRVLRPGRGCLWCADTLSPELVRQEYLDAEQHAAEVARGYVRDRDVHEPSVVALNGVVASLAVLEVCQLLVGMLGGARSRLLYRAERRSLTTAGIERRTTCHVCGDRGVVGWGDAMPLKTRWRPNEDVDEVQRLG